MIELLITIFLIVFMSAIIAKKTFAEKQSWNEWLKMIGEKVIDIFNPPSPPEPPVFGHKDIISAKKLKEVEAKETAETIKNFKLGGIMEYLPDNKDKDDK